MCGTPTPNLPLDRSDTGSSCCSPRQGRNVPAPEAREPDAATAAELLVNGMTCGHCVSGVTSELSKIVGVSDVQVSLVPGGTSKVTVFGSVPVSQEAARAAVREAGYELAVH